MTDCLTVLTDWRAALAVHAPHPRAERGARERRARQRLEGGRRAAALVQVLMRTEARLHRMRFK